MLSGKSPSAPDASLWDKSKFYLALTWRWLVVFVWPAGYIKVEAWTENFVLRLENAGDKSSLYSATAEFDAERNIYYPNIRGQSEFTLVLRTHRKRLLDFPRY